MKILIATSYFIDLSGSEITTFEYAQEFKQQGHEVTISSFKRSDTYSFACAENGIALSVFDDENLHNTLWDIIWVFHCFTYYALFSKYKYRAKRIVFSSLSHYEPLESPPVENRYIDLFTTNSKENFTFFTKSFPDYSDRAIILPNSIPRNFIEGQLSRIHEKKIIVVSNHVPHEIAELVSRLRENGWIIDIYGIGYKHKIITAHDLQDYKACITIGKTVQYCLGLQIPVFCYDRFGGPGWIKLKNIDRAEEFNFSGRCTNHQLTVDELIGCFTDNTITTKDECKELSKIAISRFSLQTNLSEILTHLELRESRILVSEPTYDNILIKSLEVYLRDQARLHEYQAAWLAETKKREKVEQQLIYIDQHLNAALMKEEEKRKEVEKNLFELNQAFHELLAANEAARSNFLHDHTQFDSPKINSTDDHIGSDHLPGTKVFFLSTLKSWYRKVKTINKKGKK